MRNLIRRTARWLGLLLTPGTGTHRAGARPVRCGPPAAEAPKPAIPLPRHRSPYGLALPLDGSETRLVRPYLTGLEVAA